MRAAIEEITVREGITMRRKDMAAFMADTFSDLREQHGRDLQAAVGAGLETATSQFEVLSPMETLALAADGERDDELRARIAPTDGTSPTVVAIEDDRVALAGSLIWLDRRRMKVVGGAVIGAIALVALIAIASSGSEDEPEAFGVAGAPATEGAGAGDRREGGASDTERRRGGAGSPTPRARSLEDFERYRVEAREAYVAGDYAGAARAYEMATEMNPVHAGSFAGLGAARLATGDVERGLSAYQEAVRLAPTHSGYQAALGRAYRQAGRDDLAEEAYREALRLDRTNRAAGRALRELRQR
jgi:tetratricopeptide (TPR) repeat protein